MADRVLAARITQAGLAAALAAANSGIEVRLTQVAIGDGLATGGGRTGYAPTGAETGLVHEIGRYLVGAVDFIAPNETVVSALCDGPAEGWINELGFFTDAGVLFALWSAPGQPLAYKTANVGVAVALTLSLSELPADLVQVIVGAPNINIIVTGMASNFASAIAQLQRDNITNKSTSIFKSVQAAADAV